MRLYCDIKTVVGYDEAPYIDCFILEHPIFGEISVTADESDKYAANEHKHCYRFKGLSGLFINDTDGIGEAEEDVYLNGKLDIIKASKLMDVICVDVHGNDLILDVDFAFVDNSILFQDGEEEFELKVGEME